MEKKKIRNSALLLKQKRSFLTSSTDLDANKSNHPMTLYECTFVEKALSFL